MDSVMMDPAERDPVLWVVSLRWIRIPRNNVMCFDAFRASAEATGEPIALADFIRPCRSPVLLDPVFIDVFDMRNRYNAFTCITLASVLNAVIAAYDVGVNNIRTKAPGALFILPDVSGMSNFSFAHQKAPFLKAFFGACSSLSKKFLILFDCFFSPSLPVYSST